MSTAEALYKGLGSGDAGHEDSPQQTKSQAMFTTTELPGDIRSNRAKQKYLVNMGA